MWLGVAEPACEPYLKVSDKAPVVAFGESPDGGSCGAFAQPSRRSDAGCFRGSGGRIKHSSQRGWHRSSGGQAHACPDARPRASYRQMPRPNGSSLRLLEGRCALPRPQPLPFLAWAQALFLQLWPQGFTEEALEEMQRLVGSSRRVGGGVVLKALLATCVGRCLCRGHGQVLQQLPSSELPS